MAVLILQTLVLGFAYGVIINYLFLYLQTMGATETLMGLTLTVKKILNAKEIPCLFEPRKMTVAFSLYLPTIGNQTSRPHVLLSCDPIANLHTLMKPYVAL